MKLLRVAGAAMLLGACASTDEPTAATADASAEERLDKYTTVRLTSPMEGLSERDRQVVGLLIDAATHMDSIFWLQAFGEPDTMLASLDDAGREFARINYGPWDRLADNQPFVEGYGPKPAGANFYPHDMTKEEFEAAAAGASGTLLRDSYTLVRRDENGALQATPYHEAYRTHVEAAAAKLREAASYADEPGLKRYLEMRADALLTDEYQPSDFAWLDMQNNAIDIIIGPIENYEDQLYGYKTAYEGVVLIKDREWSERLSHYAAMLPALQQGLPVDARYKSEQPGTDSDLNAYDVVYYAGDGNAGSKSIAINLPNDEEVQLQKGTRRLQLKNAMRAKFDEILVPIANVLIDPAVFAFFQAQMLVPQDITNAFAVQFHVSRWVASLNYAAHDWDISAEYSRWTGQFESPTPVLFPIEVVNERYYVMASHRVSSWFTPGLYYSGYFVDESNRSGHWRYQHDVAFTTRYDLNEHWLLKLEWHLMRGTAALDNRSLNDGLPQESLAPFWGAFFAKSTAYF